MDSDNSLIDKIRAFDGDIRRFETSIKEKKERLQANIEALPEYAAVESLKEQAKTAQEALKRATERLAGYNDLMEDIAEDNEALKSARMNMSDFLLGYFKETGEKQIELSEEDAREVILKGKLGKPTQYQTNLFTGGNKQ
jgi:DNA repair exonuclease SbcCD ATPase subunit